MDKNTIAKLASQMDSQVRIFRHELHQRAELALHEHQTAEYIRKILDDNGIAYKCYKTGTIAEIGTFNSSPFLALRADIDALPIKEPPESDNHSCNEGCMHACGHDCHTAMLLAAAIATKKYESELKQPIRFIFQPAEESNGGSLEMIKYGCLDNVSSIYCLHMQSGRPIGHFATMKQCIHASSDGFVIKVIGKRAHGASPSEGVDAIWAAAQIITSLQGLISRETGAFDNAVLTIGKIKGGTARNIICDEVIMDGTLRTTNNDLRKRLIKRISELVKYVAQSLRAEASFEIIQSYISCINDDSATDKAAAAVISLFGKDHLEILTHPSMGGEDFGYYEELVPGCKLYLGTGTDTPIHTDCFKVNEDTLVFGVGFYLNLILDN